MTSIVGRRRAPAVWVLVGAAVLGGLSVGGLSLGPSPVRAAEAEIPPACERNDLPTPYAAYGESERTLLDPAFRLPEDYVPPDLVSSARAGLNGGFLLRSVVIADLRDAVAAARKDGVRLAIVSGYRAATYAGRLAGVVHATARRDGGGAARRPAGTLGTSARDRHRHRRDAGSLCMDGGQRMALRLGAELPAGQDQRHLLPVRALAFPVGRARERGRGPRFSADAARVAVAGGAGDSRRGRRTRCACRGARSSPPDRSPTQGRFPQLEISSSRPWSRRGSRRRR